MLRNNKGTCFHFDYVYLKQKKTVKLLFQEMTYMYDRIMAQTSTYTPMMLTHYFTTYIDKSKLHFDYHNICLWYAL